MSNSPFKNTGKIFKFTLKQNMKTSGYKIVTFSIGFVLFALMIFVNYMMADDELKVKKVFLQNLTSMQGVSCDEIKNHNVEALEGIEDVEFIEVSDKKDKDELSKMVSEGEKAIGIVISQNEENVSIEVYVDEENGASKNDAENVGDYVSGYLGFAKVINSGLNEQQLAVIMTPVMLTDTVIGEETSIGKSLINMLTPIIFSFVLYMMLIIYGQSISKSVTAEKSSKLMEYILTLTKPYSLIAGKILAMASVALIQFMFWIACLVTGFFGGYKIFKEINPDYVNPIIEALKALKDEVSGAFSWYTIVLSLLALCLGFLFYCVLAGLIASFSQKTESLAQLMVIYQYIVMIGFFVTYIGGFMEKKTLLTVSNYVPLCSPFSLPANILIGALSGTEIAIAVGILLVTAVILIYVTARVYKALVLYNGAKITPAVIKNALFGK